MASSILPSRRTLPVKELFAEGDAKRMPEADRHFFVKQPQFSDVDFTEKRLAKSAAKAKKMTVSSKSLMRLKLGRKVPRRSFTSTASNP